LSPHHLPVLGKSPRLLADLQQELHDKANIDYDHVDIQHNPSVASLYEDGLVYESGSAITSAGALATSSGSKTGRSPQGECNKNASPFTSITWLLTRTPIR